MFSNSAVAVIILDSLKTFMDFPPRQEPGSFNVDRIIQKMGAARAGDLDEMLEMHQIRVLVVPSRSTYFLDKAGQPRGMDYELLKGYEKILNRQRKKGTPPVSLVFVPVTLEELGDALLEGRGDIAGITLITPKRAEEFAYANLETVMYVRNILNYTLAYKTAYERSLLRQKMK